MNWFEFEIDTPKFNRYGGMESSIRKMKRQFRR